MTEGKFIVLEGIDGSGTTTHAELLGKWLEVEGYPVVVTEEPSKGKIGAVIREKLKEKDSSPMLDALLFAADRLDHWETLIKPSLEANKIVISDRYVESSLIYQTVTGLELEWVAEINKYAQKPDLTIILDIDPEIGLERKATLGDKYEDAEFLYWIRDSYLTRADHNHYPVVSTEKSIGEVQTQLQNIIRPFL